MPQPTDLTPADTSSTVAPGLGRAYSILPDPLDALAAVLVGAATATGRLPVAIPGLIS